MKFVFFALAAFACAPGAFAHTTFLADANLPEAAAAFEEGRFPPSLSALVGAYEGSCLGDGTHEKGVVMTFAYFTLSEGPAFAGVNLHSSIRAEQALSPAFWNFQQEMFNGRESQRIGNAIWYRPSSPALVRTEGASYSVYLEQKGALTPDNFAYRTEFRVSPAGQLVTKVSSPGTESFYCYWYEQFMGREDVPAAYRGPLEQ
jgi:hypothetical protein